MLHPCVLTAHHSWDRTWKLSQGKFMWVVAQQPRSISCLPPAERRVSGLFEVQWQVYITPWTTSCLGSLGKGQELLPLDLLERFPAGWCRCSQVTA